MEEAEANQVLMDLFGDCLFNSAVVPELRLVDLQRRGWNMVRGREREAGRELRSGERRVRPLFGIEILSKRSHR